MKELREEDIEKVILEIGNKLTGQEIWYWESLVHVYREYRDRIDKVTKYIDDVIDYADLNKKELRRLDSINKTLKGEKK